jgi:hypothetical protein
MAREVRRIARKQIRLAIDRSRAVGDPQSDRAVHTARRHVKKVRALLQLVRPTLEPQQARSDRRLRAVNRMLAPIANGEALVGTLTRLAVRYPRRHSTALARLHGVLLRREAQIDRRAAGRHVVQTATSVLRAELAGVDAWRLRARGFRAIEPGLRRSVRRARRAMRRALARPTRRRRHLWRRRVKDLWFQVRLLDGRVDGTLGGYARLLERLDGVLGESHNCAMLSDVLTGGALSSRDETADVLRLIRRYDSELRAQARVLGGKVHATGPRRFVKDVRRAWGSGTGNGAAAGGPVPRAA